MKTSLWSNFQRNMLCQPNALKICHNDWWRHDAYPTDLCTFYQ